MVFQTKGSAQKSEKAHKAWREGYSSGPDGQTEAKDQTVFRLIDGEIAE